MTIEPSVDEGGSVLCACNVGMRPVYYRSLLNGRCWMFWRCVRDQTHISCAVPLPVWFTLPGD
jgi:hypothetical protein